MRTEVVYVFEIFDCLKYRSTDSEKINKRLEFSAIDKIEGLLERAKNKSLLWNNDVRCAIFHNDAIHTYENSAINKQIRLKQSHTMYNEYNKIIHTVEVNMTAHASWSK